MLTARLRGTAGAQSEEVAGQLCDAILRDYLAQRAGISPEREFPLLWLVGADLAGAAIADDSDGQPLPPPEEKSETREANKQEVLRFSLAGVQLKFSAIGRGGKQLRIPAQGRDGQWIVKLPSPRFPNVPENEFAMMTLAKEVGIDVPEFGLIPVGSIANLPHEFAEDKANAYFIRRFDRGRNGQGRTEKLLQMPHRFILKPGDSNTKFSRHFRQPGRDALRWRSALDERYRSRRRARNNALSNSTSARIVGHQ